MPDKDPLGRHYADDVYNAYDAYNTYDAPAVPVRNFDDQDMPRATQEKLSPTDPDGIRGMLLQETHELLEAKIRDFNEILAQIGRAHV